MSKKIINGKKYDTQTAKKISTYCNSLSPSDFGYLEETLYQKKTGEFFLYGHGGAMSRYSRTCGDGRCGGDGFEPLTEDEAKAWAEEYMDVDEYEKLFGEVNE